MINQLLVGSSGGGMKPKSTRFLQTHITRLQRHPVIELVFLLSFGRT
jgi:hypothetical protein